MQLKLLLCISLLFSLKKCNSNEIAAQKNEENYFFEELKWQPSEVKTQAPIKLDKAFKIEESLPSGYVKDGSIDYTFYIQSAINNHEVLEFPAFPLLINDNGLSIGSNRTITFPAGSELRMEPTDKGKYAVIELRNVKNVKLVNPVIIGDWDKHVGTSGEWGMGIRVVSSSDIEIYNPKISKCWGDGLYITGSAEQGPSKNITVVNAYCKKNRRNGISIISVDRLKLISPYSGYNDGVDPKSGIDIEPNNPQDQVKNISIINPQTEKNPGMGIAIAINKLYGSTDRTVNIDIQKHVDHGSLNAFLISCHSKKSVSGEKVKGIINVTDPVWKYNSKTFLSVYKFREPALHLNIQNASVTDISGKNISKAALKEIVQTTIGANSSYVLK